MAGRKSDFTLPTNTLDELFSSQEERDEAKLSKIRDIPLEEIDDFPDHPFKVREDEDMRGNLKIVKTSSDGKVEGFAFRITGANGYDVTLETDENGEIFLEGLRIGEYKISEVNNSVSAMYILPADKEAAVQVGSTTVVEMHNELRDTPKTGDNSKLGLWIALAGVSVAGIAACGIIGFKKKKKEDN